MASTVPAREDIPAAHTWDLESVYPSVDAWEAAYAEVESALGGIGRFSGRLGEGPETLLDWFTASEGVGSTLRRVSLYASMAYSGDTGDEAAKALQDRARGLMARAGAATAFGEPEIIAIGFDTLRQWTERDERLAVYTYYFDVLEREQQHVRSAEIEELLGMVRDPFGSAQATHGILVDTDLRFRPVVRDDGETIEIAQGNYMALMEDRDRAVRCRAWEAYADGHLGMQHTLANALSTGVKQHVFLARARRYGSSLEAALGPMQLPTEVFHNLISVFQRNIPIWHRYWEVRRRALNLDRLRPYDVWAPLTAQPPVVPYEHGVEMIVQGMRPLGAEYVETLRRGALEERWVDRYPSRGKRSGAFSTGAPGTHPFILMSYTDSLFNVSTLAHEFGHSMHSYYTRQTQPLVYQWYGTFLAEIASNFNQALVRAHLLETTDDPAFSIALIEEAMYNYHRYFFVMPTLARFELAIHEQVERGEALTASSLNTLMATLLREAYGNEVDLDWERVGITWAQFPTHMYLNFYVWQYATGIAAASALASAVLEEGQTAADRYLEFLRAGGSRNPLDTLARTGLDMRSPEPVERAFGVLSDLVDRLDALTS